MNNEEKILQILTQMQGDVSGLKEGQARLEGDVSSLKTDVSGLKTDVSGLKEGQAKLEQKFDKLDSKVSSINNSVIRMENRHGELFGALFDKTETINDNVNIIREDIEYIKTISERHDMGIIALENKKTIKKTARRHGSQPLA